MGYSDLMEDLQMIKVMIIEDDPMVRSINIQFLNKISGIKLVKECGRIEEAKKSIVELRDEIDLVLIDIFLPDGNGIDFLKWTRNENITVDAILITADRSKEAVRDAFKYGAMDYLIKPFRFDRLKEALEKYRTIKKELYAMDELDQEHIDSFMLSKTTKCSESSMPKGINIKTYESIINFLYENPNEKLTSEEIADKIGLSRVTVRRYLEKLYEENKVDKICEYGKIGRPTNYYMLLNS